MTVNPRIKPIERATNRSWDEWVAFMDKIGAKDLDHHRIAVKVFEELNGSIDNVGWWAQAVTVAYEQHIGRRLPGQNPDGTFQTSVSKSTQLSMKKLMDAWVAFAGKDREILDLIAAEIRVSGTENRITWRTKAKDGSQIIVTSEPKSNGTASVIATQIGLKTEELNHRAKATWTTLLERFLATL